MKKIIPILFCLPMIGFASFPMIIVTEKCDEITVLLDYDVNQKKVKENSKIETINLLLEKNDPWSIIEWLIAIFLSLFLILVVIVVFALTAADLN